MSFQYNYSSEPPAKRAKVEREDGEIHEDPNKPKFIQEHHGTRWNGQSDLKSFIPGVPLLLPSRLSDPEINALLLRARIEEISYQLKNPQLLESIPRRSPSPPPTYDGNGKRTNTRDQRMKAHLERERHQLIEKAKSLNPQFKPPADYKPVSSKVNLKIKIPVDRHPQYNFIGLILGPRGQTQKDMERKTNTKISIRGKGAVKNEAKRRYANPDDNEDLHVLITGDSETGVKDAAKLIEQLLVPIDDEKNEHKWKQLEMLAEMNGTKTGNWKGKKRMFGEGNVVCCTFCGEVSHPTSDCPFKDKPGAVSKFDVEYVTLMTEIGEPKEDTSEPSNSATEQSYSELMALLDGQDGEASPTTTAQSDNERIYSSPSSSPTASWQPQSNPPVMPPLVESVPVGSNQPAPVNVQPWSAYGYPGMNYNNGEGYPVYPPAYYG